MNIKSLSFLKIFPFILLVYVTVIGTWTLVLNYQGGGLIQGWYSEYAGNNNELSGSGKWRTDEGRSFQNFSLLFGTWVYPFSLIASVIFIIGIVKTREILKKALYAISAIVPLYFLYRFVSLGLIQAILELG
ncbi:hypothetical protein BVX98_00430 [bacterium F11]|nr:hypothetical protein BVX98_00430 [bacterium F11]